MSEGRERRVERAQRDLQIAEALHGRGGGTVGHFEAKLHPRDRTGKWRETFSSPERPLMGQTATRPKPQQEFARAFGGPQSTAMSPPPESPPPGALYAVRVGDHVRYYMNEQDVAEDAEAINAYVETDTPFTITDLRTGRTGENRFPPVSRRGDERPNALSPDEHQFARAFGPIPTDTAGLREFRARVAERIASSPDDGGPRFRAQTRKLQASTVKKIDAAIRSGRGLIIPEAPAAPAPAPRPDPYQARIDSIKAATGLSVTEPETSFLPFGSALSNDLHAMRAHAAERIQSSPDDGGPEFRRRARAAQKSLLAKIDAAIASGPIVGAPGSAYNPHPGAQVQIHSPDGKVFTGSSLGNGLALVQRKDTIGSDILSVFHIKHGLALGSIGASGRDVSRAKYAFQRHWAGANTNQSVEALRADPDIRQRATNQKPVIDATDTDAHRAARAATQARAAERLAPADALDAALAAHDAGNLAAHIAGLTPDQRALVRRGTTQNAVATAPGIAEVKAALDQAESGRERRVQAVMSGDRGQRTGARVGGREGRWLTIQGKKKHIPRGADWAHDAGSGVKFDSPAGGTDVYRTGPEGTRELVSQPGQRGTHADVRQLPFRRGGSPPPGPVAPAAPHVDPASSPAIAARQAALSAMTPGEHRMIDGVYVSRSASGDFGVHHGWGSPLYRDRGISGASDENLAASANGPHTVVLDSLHAAAEAAKSAPNINMTPMTTAHQMESRLKKGDKVAARYVSGGEHHGGNATVERVNQASIAVKMVDGPHAGRVVSVPRYQPFKPNSRWTVNNRVEPRNAKIDQHVSRVASTPISGGRLLQKVGNDTGRLSNAPRQQDGRLMYLVDGQGPYTPQEALQLLGLPASGATPAEYEAWRRSQGLREADFSAGRRRKLAKRGKALPDGSFPIENLSQLKDAIQALGRAKDKVRAKRHIIKRAHALGCVSALPTDWKVQEAEMDARERRVAIEILADDPALIALAEAHDKGAEPFSTSKTSNWVARAGGLPHYIQHIAHDLMEKRGMPESKAIAMAIGIVKRWARGGGKVKPDTRAAAAKAVAEWESKKARSHAA